MGAAAATGPVGMGILLGGAALSSLSQIGSTVGAVQEAETTPPQAHGDLNSGDVMFAYTRNSISFYMMSVRESMARIIDDYFTMYGYKTNRVKVPNCFGRSNWNFVKTIGCYIQADIPQDDLQQIKEMFDAGITLWHNPATFLDYSQSNNII